MGRTKESTVVKMVRKRAKNQKGAAPKSSSKGESIYGGPLTRAPDYITGYAKYVFRHVIEVMPEDAFRKADRSAVVGFCEAVAVHRMAYESVRDNGFVIYDERGIGKANPATAALHQAAGRIISFAKQLGLTPKARAGLGVDTLGEEDKDGWSDFS